jgi:catechol 2,3-dioxygenase-like lactoylglutathione lyase family enzyme
MLINHTPIAVIATQDLARARSFYEGVLGFIGEEQMEGVSYKAGSGSFFVYPSQFAGTNQATAMSFEISGAAFDDEVAKLRDAGIDFDTFEAEGLQWIDGVAVAEGFKAVWFTDPDGNVLNVTDQG